MYMNKGVTVHLISTRINASGNFSEADREEARKRKEFRSLVIGNIYAAISEIDENTSTGVARVIFGYDEVTVIHRKAAADFILERLAQRHLKSVVLVANPQDARPILQKICEHLMGFDKEKREDALSKTEAMLGHLLDEGNIELRSFYFPDEDEDDCGFKITLPGNAEFAS